MTINAPVRLLSVLAFGSLLATPVAAQEVGGWTAWIGCWEPIASGMSAGSPSAVCVVPDESNAVRMIAIENGQTVTSDRFPSVGGRIDVDRDGCAGSETIRWSEDQRRLFNRTDMNCVGEIERHGEAIFSILPTGEWLSVEGLTVGEETSVRTILYRPVDPPTALAPSDRASIDRISLAVETARTVASARIDVEDVVEAIGVAGDATTEGWLIESEQGFDLDAEALRELAHTDLPDSVIDLMIALSYPNVFAIDRDEREGERMASGPRARWPRGRGAPWYYPVYGRGYYGGYYGGGYGRPVIIVRDGSGRPNRDNGGRLVNGRGYSRPSGNGASTSREPSGPSTSVGTSGGRDDSPRSTGRTAKPRE